MADCEFSVIFPPNLPLSNVDRQKPIIYDDILYIDINSKGGTIVGSSSITDTYWESTLFYYDSTKTASKNEASCFVQLASTVGVGKFFGDNKILLAEDYLPSLKLLTISDSTNSPAAIVATHTEEIAFRVTALSLWHHTTKAISSAGNAICVWNIQNGALTLLNQYMYYHTDVVNDVDSCKGNQHIFASVSSDRRACLWDIRQDDQPAQIVYENEFSSLTTAAFDPSNEHLNYYGSEGGDIYTVDLRKPLDCLSATHCYDSYGIFKMNANNNTEKGVKLAVCGDGPDIKVFDTCKDGLKLKYANSSENGSIVRDLGWSPDDVLYSCGFNREFSEHFM